MPSGTKRFPDAVPIIGLGSCVVLAFALPVTTIALGLAVLVAGFVLRPILSSRTPAGKA